jgi:hypothetical protein
MNLSTGDFALEVALGMMLAASGILFIMAYDLYKIENDNKKNEKNEK